MYPLSAVGRHWQQPNEIDLARTFDGKPNSIVLPSIAGAAVMMAFVHCTFSHCLLMLGKML